MLTDGLQLTVGSKLVRAVLESGATFPASPVDGQMFRLTVTVGANGPGSYWYDLTTTSWITGDISSVTAGTGLIGGASRGAVSLELDTAYTDGLYFPADGVTGMASIFGNFPGAVASVVGAPRYYPSKSIVLSRVVSWTSAVSTVDLVISIRKNGTAFHTVTIPIGTTKVTNVLAQAVTLTDTDYLTIDIVSGTGTDLTVRLDY